MLEIATRMPQLLTQPSHRSNAVKLSTRGTVVTVFLGVVAAVFFVIELVTHQEAYLASLAIALTLFGVSAVRQYLDSVHQTLTNMHGTLKGMDDTLKGIRTDIQGEAKPPKVA